MPFQVTDALLHAYATNDRINAFLIKNVPDEAWRAKPPGGKGRDIASIAAHIHNVRLMWLKSAGKTAGSFLAYMPAHDAHHRGQISMLARQPGYPISQSAMFGLWEWGTR